jgi:NAD-dependent deacetylase
MEDSLDAVADAVLSGGCVVALTGAGISTASGIPTFRGEDGVWGREFRPRDFALGRFENDPEGFWRDRVQLHSVMYPDDVAPNAAHEALARLESQGHLEGIITQNTDGLHSIAGSDRVVELHGNANRVVCRDCGEQSDAAAARQRVTDGELPPLCPDCGGVLKPDVVLFGERLPQEQFDAAHHMAQQSDVFLAVGSSLVVEPAASLPGEAARNGTLVIVNLEETPVDDEADIVVNEDLTEVLPRLAELVEARR